MKKHLVGMLCASLRGFLGSTHASMVIMLAFALPALIAAGGVATDIAQAYNVKNHLSNALDKAALAAGSTTGTDAEVKARAKKFFDANYPPDAVGATHDLVVNLDVVNGTVSVSASATVNTIFMAMIGIKTLDVNESVTAKRETVGVEAVLVLDITGSMNDPGGGGNSKIYGLRQAAQSFVDTMFTNISDVNYLKIGIVPFSVSVNVGNYGLGVKPDGSVYGTGTAFVNKPASDDWVTPAPGSSIVYGNGSTNWSGCIEERASPLDTADFSTPNWEMYRYPRKCNTYNCQAYKCQTYQCQTYQCQTYVCTKKKSNGTCQTYSTTQCQTYSTTQCATYSSTCQTYSSTCQTFSNTCKTWASGGSANTDCPTSQVVPMTNVKSTLTTAISGLTAGGATFSDVGMAWGWRLISSTAPFNEGSVYGDTDWTKTVILMTDGDNNYDTTYSAYGKSGSIVTSDSQLDTKLSTICAAMKADPRKIRIYTIAFAVSSNDISASTQTMLKNCATDSTKYFLATDTTAVNNAFKQIGKELSDLHITQ